MDTGPAAELVVASCSLPFFGKPYVYGDMILVDSFLTRNESAPLHKLLDVNLIVAIQTAWPKQSWSRPKTKLSIPRTVARFWQVLISQWSETVLPYDLVIAPIVPGEFADMSPQRVEPTGRTGPAGSQRKAATIDRIASREDIGR